jgi:hypothetical protein
MVEREIGFAARRLNKIFNIAAGPASAKDEAIGGEESSDELRFRPVIYMETMNELRG